MTWNIDNNVTEDIINRELFKIYEWLVANKLVLSVSKTKFIVFHTCNKSEVSKFKDQW